MMKAVVVTFMLGFLYSCASAPPPIVVAYPPKLSAEPVVVKKTPEVVNVAVPDFSPPADAGTGQSGGAGDSVATPAGVDSTVAKYTAVPHKENFLGGAVEYPYLKNWTYTIWLSPSTHTDLSLEPGETLIGSPAAGDNQSFNVLTAMSQIDGRSVVHLLLFGFQADTSTTMSVFTNKRTYELKLVTYAKSFMPIVSFRYPLDEAQSKALALKEGESSLSLSVNLSDCDFNYDVAYTSINKPVWSPTVIFTDHLKTYINFASAGKMSHAPVVFLMNPDGTQRVVNVHPVGTFLVVDEVIEVANLVVDRNNGNIVTIKHFAK